MCAALIGALVLGPAMPAFAFSLRDVPVVEPTNLHAFVKGRSDAAATPAERAEAAEAKRELIVLGKALFWDMQLGSDNVQSCATCHFNAGADPRPTNQLNPGDHGSDPVFGNPSRVVNTGAPGPNQAPWDFRFGVNTALAPGHFPFHLRSQPTAPVGGPLGTDPEFAGLLRDTNDVASSQGVRAGDLPWPFTDSVFTWGSANQRKVEPRNAPSMINAVFHIDMFWDGRASFVFNGQNPFGFRDRDATVWRQVDGARQNVKVRIPFAAHASQAVGPPLSDHEMSGIHRQFVDVGAKMVVDRNLVPLAKQAIHPNDSVLGQYAKAAVDPSSGELNDVPGMKDMDGSAVTYEELIKRVFRPEWTSGGDEQLKENFALFLGLAMQAYQGTLVADQTPYDAFVGTQNDVRRGGGPIAADPGALTQEQLLGLDIYQNTNLSGLNGTPGNPALPAVLGGCFACHTLPETSNSNFRLSGAAPLDANGNPVINFNVDPATGGDPTYDDPTALVNAVLPNLLVEPMPMGAFQQITPEMIAVIESIAGPPDFQAPPTPLEPFPVPRWDLTPAEWQQIIADPLFATFTTGLGLYDVGFYNLGVRPTEEDLGRKAFAPPTTGFPSGLPLAYVDIGDMMRNGIPVPADVRAHVPEITPVTTVLQPLDVPTTSLTVPVIQLTGVPTAEFPAVTRGAFKVPNLRNQQFMGPYFHNGGDATLAQVVEFYTRGGNFPITNLMHRDADIVPIPGLDISGPDVPVEGGGVTNERRLRALVDFLVNGLTDPRVEREAAPFDHPQLIMPEGVNGRLPGSDRIFELKATGAAGSPNAIPRFLNMDPFAGGDPSDLGKIAGRVTRDDTGEIVQGVSVSAHLLVNGVWETVAQDYTDGTGSYRLDALRPGSYKVRFRDELGGYVAETYSDAPYTLAQANGQDVAVTAGATTPSINVSLGVIVSDAMEADDTSATAKPVTTNVTQQRTLDLSDPDWIVIDGRAANSYRFETSGDDVVDTQIHVFTAEGDRVAGNNDGGGIAPYSLLNYAPAADGPFYVRITGRNDAAGAYTLSVSATDNTPPTTTSDVKPSYNGTATVAFAPTDDWSGVTSTQYTVDGGAPQTGTSVQVSELGTHTIEFWSTDASGNIEERNSATFVMAAEPSFLSMQCSPLIPSYGGQTTVSGILRSGSTSGPGLAGETVLVQARAANAASWSTVATLTTGAAGGVSWSTVPRVTTYYRLIYDGNSNMVAAADSIETKVTARVRLTGPAARRFVRSRRPFTVAGTIAPRHTAGSRAVTIQMQRLQRGRWVTRKSLRGIASNHYSYSRYSSRTSLWRGVWRIRTAHYGDSMHGSTYTGWRYIIVR